MSIARSCRVGIRVEARCGPARVLAGLALEDVEDKPGRLRRRGIEVLVARVAAAPGVAQALDAQAPRREPAIDEPVRAVNDALAERTAVLGVRRGRRRSARGPAV